MFTTAGKPEAAYFNQILVAIYLAGAAYYFVYQLCGKHKPWCATASALATVILLSPSCLCLLMSFATSCLVACWKRVSELARVTSADVFWGWVDGELRRCR